MVRRVFLEPKIIVGDNIRPNSEYHQVLGKAAIFCTLEGEACLVVGVVLPVKCQGSLGEVVRRQIRRRNWMC